MEINRRINLVIPVETTAGEVHVHSTPISREVFAKYFRVIGKTYAEIVRGGFNVQAGPQIAALLLREIAEAEGTWDTIDGVRNGLVAEIFRLTTVLVPSPNGWQYIPFSQAITTKILADDDVAEVENTLVYFIVSSAMLPKRAVPGMTAMAARLRGGLVTSLNSTEYGAGLLKSKEEESIGEKAKPASVPS